MDGNGVLHQNEGVEEEGGDIVFQAVQYDNADFLAELLSENLALVGFRDENGKTALHFAALEGHSKSAELLLQAGADIDAVSGISDSLRTPLVMAASMGKAKILGLLIEAGADLFYFDSEGHSALQLAQMNGHPHCAHILITAIEKLHRDAKIKNQRLCSACIDGNLSEMLGILADLGHKNVRKEILNGPAEAEQKSALFLAAENGRAELVAELLNISGHSIIFEPTGDTILHAAIASKHRETVEIIFQKFSFLMEAPNQEKNFPLHWACRCGNLSIVELLLKFTGYPLDELKFFEFPHESQKNVANSRKLGYLFPCDLNAPDQEGRSPLYLAILEGNVKIVEFLSKFKMPAIDGSNSIGSTNFSTDQMIEMESPFVFDTYVNGRTPLMVACTNGSAEIVRFLLESNHVDVNLPIALTEAETTSTDEAHCLDGSGALIEAAKRGHSNIIRLLFRHGAFDYGNRALAEMIMLEGKTENVGGNNEGIGLFLEHLTFADAERKIHLPFSKKPNENGHLEKISMAAGNLLASQNSIGQLQMTPIKGCQLNWAGTGVRELKLEWLLAASSRMNPQPSPRQQIRNFPLLAITRIDISGNQIRAIPAFLFTQLSSLFQFDASKNFIHRLDIPPECADWQSPQLEMLILDQNQLEELPVQLFSGQHFPRLRQLSAQGNRLRRFPASIWTAPRLTELNLANNELCEINSTIMDLRRTSHGQLCRQGGTAAARISRHQRGKREEKEKSGINRIEPEERQSRSTTKRESPHQKSAGNSRRCSNEQQQTERGMGGRKASATESEGSASAKEEEGSIIEVDILRTNIWQKRIQLSNIDDNAEENNKDDQQQEIANNAVDKQIISSLRVLNLAGNKFARMPTCLACCCPRLNRLDFSRNSLTSLGPIECLPSALKHLDFSGNKLSRCFVELPTQLKQKLKNCEAPNSIIGTQNGELIQGSSMARHSRSRSKSVARSQRSLSVVRQANGQLGQNVKGGGNISDSFCCLHKSHFRLDALRTLNLANNSLKSLELLLVPLSANEPGKPQLNAAELSILLANMAEERRFDWKESGEHLKPYLLFPSLTSLDASSNQLEHLPQVISLHSSLAVLNLANNPNLERLPPELGLLDKLWNIGLNGCMLKGETQQIRQFVQAGNYKTAEVLSHMRQRLENSIAYPKMKLMLLGGSAVGKTTLLHQMRLEGTMPKKSLQNESWSRRMGHSPVKGFSTFSPSHTMGRSSSQQRIPPQSSSLYPVEVAEWTYEPQRKSSSKSTQPSAEAFKGPITFRTWDFDGIKQKEQLSTQICFFTRRCLYLLLWKVTDGEIALDELQERLIAIQERAPNSSVLIIGSHSDFVREQEQRFPKDYLTKLDQQIQDRFIAGVDPEKRGLPRVLGSLYLSCRSREDVKSLCSLIYTCAGHIGTGRSGSKLKLAEKVPASFLALERVVVNMTDEMRANWQEPILHFQEFWSATSERLLSEPAAKPVQFRDAQDFRQACLFLHENGILCHFDDTLLRDYVFLDPPWLCALLRSILAYSANQQRLSTGSENSPSPLSSSTQSTFPQVHQNSLIDSKELYAAIKQSIKQHLLLTNASNIAANPSDHSSLAKHFRLFRQCGMSLLRKFELALPCQNGKLSLLASFLPDEYLLRADYPGSKVRIRTKFDKLKLRLAKMNRPKSLLEENYENGNNHITPSPIRNYLEHRRLSRAIVPVNIENNGSEMAAKIKEQNSQKLAKDIFLAETNDWVKILEMEQTKEEFLRRLYVMHYVPQGFWPRLITRFLDDERLGDALSKLLLLTRANESAEAKTAEEEGATLRLDAVATALAKALNAGRVLNLVQQRSSVRRQQNDRKADMKEEDEEVETSFIVLNPAEEVTEKSIETTNNGSAPTMVVRCCEKGVEASDENGQMIGNGMQDGGNGIEWLLWRTGMEIRTLGTFLLSLRQFLPLASVQDLNYATHQLFRRFEDAQWRPLTTPNEEGHQQGFTHMVELLVPQVRIRLKWREALWELRTDRKVAARVLVLVSSIIDDLLEDWYPQLGTRFVLSSHGLLLVDRLIPCDRCSIDAIQEEDRYWLRENINRNPAASADFVPARPTRSNSTKFNQKNDARRLPKSKSSTTTPLSSGLAKNQLGDGIGLNHQKPLSAPIPSPVYLFSMEECILEARKALKNVVAEEIIEKGKNVERRLECPRHGPIGWSQMIEEGEKQNNEKIGPDFRRMCPDLLFIDLQDQWQIQPESIRRGKLLGRGAFGFVFTGTISSQFRRKPLHSTDMAALKILEPIEPTTSLHQLGASAQAAFRAFKMKWHNDLMEQSTRAYCMARQEICMLSELAHPHCTQMLAFCVQPMTLLLELAPSGSLDKILAEYRRCGQRLHVESVQRSSLQIAKALEYLHVQQHIIYRDLKSENVLIWRFPSPNTSGRPKSTSPTNVLLKLGDYGISRFSYPSGVCKGYGGTEGFMAPEIMRYNGEQEYSERVDCFSFGMFLYELITLRQPYEGFQMQQMKERILEAQRPNVTERELLHPTNVLDLMVTCWEEMAELRPSSSQLVGICSAPEYAHLLDMALLKDGEAINAQNTNAATTGIIQQLGGGGGMHDDENAQHWLCWIPCGNAREEGGKNQANMVSLLQCSPFGWTEKKLFKLPYMQASPIKKQYFGSLPKITAIVQVYEEFLWLGDESGNLAIFVIEKEGSAAGPIIEQPLFGMDLTKTLEYCPKQIAQFQRDDGEECEEIPHHESLKRTTPKSSELEFPFAILQISTFPERQIVVIALCSAILLARWQGREQQPQFITNIQFGTRECRLFCLAILPSLGDWQIWTGHSQGRIFIHHISSSINKLAFSTSTSHFESKEKFSAQKVSSVSILITSKCVRNLLWSVMENDSRLFMWRDSQLQKMLNCAKILPVSESLSSLEGPEEASSNSHFITALELLDLGGPSAEESEEQLLVGTTRGILLTIKAMDLQPISCFRPYFGPIHRILCCPANARLRPSTSRILQNELLSATNNLPFSSPSTQLLQTKTIKKRSTVMEKSRSIMLKAAGLQSPIEGKHLIEKQKSMESPSIGHSPSSFAISEVRNEVKNAVDEFCEAVKVGMRGIFTGNEVGETKFSEENTPESFFVTIGRDYRPLLNRFVGNMAETIPENKYDPDGENCAIFWRATSH